MLEGKANRFLKYFVPLVDALRSTDPTPMRPAEARAWIRARVDVPPEDLNRRIENGKQSIFENDVHWARFYLVKAGLLSATRRGLWALTEDGRTTKMTRDTTWALYVRVRDADRVAAPNEEVEVPAPDVGEDELETGTSYWFVGAVRNKTDDQMPRFLNEGSWQNGYEEQFTDVVRRMKPGDRIAIKASFVQRHNLPFDVGGKPVSVMRIKATGTILTNQGDGRTVKVAWDPAFEPRDWYFYTYLTTVVEVDLESESARRLIDFAFRGAPQDYGWFLGQPYWVQKYGTPAPSTSPDPPVAHVEPVESELIELDEPAYTVDDIVNDGCFLGADELQGMLERWRSKKNLVLQGPPGTGKTWLAKRLGFALVGSNDRETTRSRLRVVQFHPSLAYEDFVRGWRPSGDGRLSLVDGILMQSIDAAVSEPDRPFVLVIEKINRGNPAQIFGEMLTLLEDSKRRPSEAVELAYRRSPDERVYIPSNLYIVGTMNVADRSLAMVDLALRRRFGFVDLEPRFGPAWRSWCARRGVDEAVSTEIAGRIAVLNAEITSASSLGPQFRIGHSYFTPDVNETISDTRGWFRAKVETEIGPLLDEYWYDMPETAKAARTKLLAQLI